MPNRILRDWTDSETISHLSADEERLFVRLLMRADDYGRYHASPRLINAGLFPLLNLRDTDISRWRDALVTAGLIAVYHVKGREYLAILRFGQRQRASKSKFPQPDGMPADWLPDGAMMPAECAQSARTAPASCAQNDGHMADIPPPYSETETKSKAIHSPVASTGPPGFVEFWELWPSHDRKCARKKCVDRWTKAGLEACSAQVIDGLKAWCVSEKWAEDAGKYIPMPLTWLNQERWLTTPKPLKPKAVESPKQIREDR